LIANLYSSSAIVLALPWKKETQGLVVVIQSPLFYGEENLIMGNRKRGENNKEEIKGDSKA
jgi:hypothetical protein